MCLQADTCQYFLPGFMTYLLLLEYVLQNVQCVVFMNLIRYSCVKIRLKIKCWKSSNILIENIRAEDIWQWHQTCLLCILTCYIFLNWAQRRPWCRGTFSFLHKSYELWMTLLKSLQSLSTVRQFGYFAKYRIFLFEWCQIRTSKKWQNFQFCSKPYILWHKNRRKFLHCNNEIWAMEEKLTAGLSFLVVSPLLNLFLVHLVSKILWVRCVNSGQHEKFLTFFKCKCSSTVTTMETIVHAVFVIFWHFLVF